jgi:hypothetical protein
MYIYNLIFQAVVCIAQRFSNVGHPPVGMQLVLWEGVRFVSMRDIYFERNMATIQNTYFYRYFSWFKYFTYHLVPV